MIAVTVPDGKAVAKARFLWPTEALHLPNTGHHHRAEHGGLIDQRAHRREIETGTVDVSAVDVDHHLVQFHRLHAAFPRRVRHHHKIGGLGHFRFEQISLHHLDHLPNFAVGRSILLHHLGHRIGALVWGKGIEMFG